jgi:hypothetical protein
VATLAAGNCQGIAWNDVLTGSACRSRVTILGGRATTARSASGSVATFLILAVSYFLSLSIFFPAPRGATSL